MTVIVVTFVICFLGFLSFAITLMSNAWKESYDTYQWLATKISWVCFIGAFFTNLNSRYKSTGILVLVGILGIVFTIAWSPYRDHLKKQDNLLRIVDKNQDALDRAITIAECNNGQRAVVSKSRLDRSDGSRLTWVNLSIFDKDLEKPYKSIVGSTGETYPKLQYFRDLLRRKPEFRCSNKDYPNLGAMLDLVIDHYYQQRPKIYPDDPLYTKKALPDGILPVDPLDLSEKIYNVNQDNIEKRVRIKPFSFVMKRRDYHKGNISKERVETVKGNAKNMLFWVNDDENPTLLRTENGISYQYKYSDFFSFPANEPTPLGKWHAGELVLRGGRGTSRIFSWGKPVVHHKRPSKEFIYEATEASDIQNWIMRHEYIVDDESGIVAQARILKQGLIIEEEIREFQNADEVNIQKTIKTIIDRTDS